jgi:capsular polysaccharide transport system permease protein
VRQLQDRLPIARMFQGEGVDFLSRYPSILFNSSQEGLYRYLWTRLTVIVNPSTGIETLRVEAFQPEDAKAIATTLLELSEELVNHLNERIRQDAVRVAETEVAVARERQVTSQIALTAFRNRELMLDPSGNALIVVQLIDHLYSQLADTRTAIAEMQAGSQRSPQLAGLQARAAALEEQIARERRRIASTSDGLAEKIAEYERLDLDHEFATRALVTTLASLEIARAEARRQQLFLVRVVEPGLADEATEPRRLRGIFTMLGLNLIAAGVAWLLFSGLREHAAYRGD